MDKDLFQGLLKVGLYLDAIGVPFCATTKEILRRLMDLEREYLSNQEMVDLLHKSRNYLINRRTEYKEWVLPCLDYILILIENKYGLIIKEGIIKHGVLKIDNVEKWLEKNFEQKPESPLKDLLAMLSESVLEDDPFFKLLKDTNKIEFVKALLRMGPEDLDYLYFDGECDNSIPLRKKAYQVALEAFQNLPDDPSLLDSLGFSLIELSDHNRALTCFQRQYEKAGNGGSVWNNIAWCQMRLGKYEEALVPCERALKLLPDHSHVHHDYATILAGLSRWDEAIKVIKNAISNLEPQALQLYYLLPSVLERKDDITTAIIYWKQYLKLATGRAGHERAVLRVQNKLEEKGVKFSGTGKSSADKKYPIRKISEDVFNEIASRINTILDIAKKHDIKSHQFVARNEIEQKQGVLEPRCKRIFEEAFTIIKGLPSATFVLGIGGESKTLSSNDLYSYLKREHESKGIPFCILVRDVVSRIIDDIPIFAVPLTGTSLTSLKSEIKTIENEMESITKMVNFFSDIGQVGEHMEPETIKWLFSTSNSFKVKEKVISGMDIEGILEAHKNIFTNETIKKYGISEFDYSPLWIEELSNKLHDRNELLQSESSLKQKDRGKLKDKLSSKENEKKNIENDLTKKLQKLNQESRDNLKILDLLQTGENAINSVKNIKKAGGVIGKLSGRKGKIEKVSLELETICSQINKLGRGVIEEVI